MASSSPSPIMDNDNNEQTQPQAQDDPIPNPQSKSPLFTLLPPELRTQIYTHHFRTLRLSTGARLAPSTDPKSTCHSPRQILTPSRHTLALLYVCRLIHAELTDIQNQANWLRHVLFDFAEPYTMLDTFFWMPPAMLGAIKRVRVAGEGLVFTIFDESTQYSFAGAFKLLPGLRLDELTVLGCPVHADNYKMVRDLIQYGGGWKTLRFIAHEAEMFEFGPVRRFEEAKGRVRQGWWQLVRWERMLWERDGGQDSGSSVVGYVARDRKTYGVVLDPGKRVPFYRWTAPEEEEEDDEEAEGWIWRDFPIRANGLEMGSDDDREEKNSITRHMKRYAANMEREVLIVVTRGDGVDIEDKEDSPFIKDDPREHEFGATWGEISAAYCWGYHRHPLNPAKHGPPRVDVYSHPEEYVWSKQHMCKDAPYHWNCEKALDEDAGVGSEQGSDEILGSDAE